MCQQFCRQLLKNTSHFNFNPQSKMNQRERSLLFQHTTFKFFFMGKLFRNRITTFFVASGLDTFLNEVIFSWDFSLRLVGACLKRRG